MHAHAAIYTELIVDTMAMLSQAFYQAIIIITKYCADL